MDNTGNDVKGAVEQFRATLGAIEQQLSDELTPAMLSMAGRLGTLNRQAMDLAQAAFNEASRLREQEAAGDVQAATELDRLRLSLRDSSSSVERDVKDVRDQLAIITQSIDVCNDILEYISNLRKQLVDRE